ncbi:hypothetical protein [Carboxylicivirga marina]|uniref:hypothetical protein n=1 Tax=Carboxylicivirga marina TaxID=2800988 RepID=UPI0025959197|nr:hypothetical protein [uncultured Carboxylicivirga sp.]
MHNIYKVAVTLFLVVIIGISTTAQNRTYSPYSRYGIGEIQDGGFGRNAAMGNTGIALSSSYNLNNINPASYFSMDSISFFFEGGVSGFDQKLETETSTARFSDMNFSYFAIGYPVSKWGFMSIGVKPESIVGYSFFDDNATQGVPENSGDYTRSIYQGNGNTTKAYTGIALSPIDNLSVGAHISYIFGKISRYSLADFPNDPSAIKLASSEEFSINDLFFDFGLQYRLKLKERHNIVFGAIYNPKSGVNGKIKKTIGTGTTFNQDGVTVINPNITQDSTVTFKGKDLELAQKFGFGIAYNIDELLTITADYSIAKWSESKFPSLSTSTNDPNAFTIGDEQTVAFGVEYIPNYRSANFYPSRIKYRLGTSYKQEYLMTPASAGGDHLKDFGITFGMGLPLKRSKTSFNLAFEWGQRGSTDNSLIKENYMRFTMNLTLHEYWFMKRKFD